jgi:DNA-binding transcriptional MocR family regulator
MWNPRQLDADKSRYAAIADAIAEDIANGTLKPGEKLPTQRSLAKCLDVTVGTIGRAYALAEKRGLVSLEVGRGSFIRSFESRTNELGDRHGVIDLGLNLPPITQHAELLSRTLAQISNSRDITTLFGNAPVESFEHHRIAAASWLSDRIECSEKNTLICSGTQNALVSSLTALTNPGDSVLVEEQTFPGMIAAASLLKLKLIPVAMDDNGIVPKEFEKASKTAKVLYCTPTNQNPTTVTMSKSRRRDIARIAINRNVVIVEDDVYGKLIQNSPPPIASLAPKNTILISSIAKTLSVGLRLAFVCVPSALRQSMMDSMRATNFFPAPLLCEIATNWINDGVANRLLTELQDSARLRQQIAREIIPEKLIYGKPLGNHVWLKLPTAWTPNTLERAARENNVNLYSADLFVPSGEATPNAVRIALGAARNETELRVGLSVIARLLADSAEQPIEARY